LYLVGLLLLSTAKLAGQSSEQEILKEANMRFDQGRYADAMPLYAQLLSLNSSKPEFHFKYGATALYGDTDKKQEAIKNLRFAAGKPGVDPLCWYYLGRAYHLNYQFADAIKAYEKFKTDAPKLVETYQVSREIEACNNGQQLLSKIKEVVVLDKKQTTAESFFRLYDLSDIGGKILVTPDELLTPLDKKRNHKSLIHFRGAGGTVYFSSYGKDGKTGLDIYRADMLPDGNFSQPVALGPNINTPYDEDYPYLHPDDKTFYFSSKGHKGMGGYDVYKSSFDIISGAYSSPENLDFAVNTPDDDIFYIVDSKHALANFASARNSRQGELHVYKVEVSSNPLDITLIKGAFANKVVPANKTAKITLTDAATNAELEVHYTDPKSGDYLLSFPKAGRYKLLVEVQGSNMVHSGLVDIPKGTGISAYLQEMELITSAGLEKLIINNLFEKQYEGDIAALAQNLLRQKASLDVNFYASNEKAPVAVPDGARSADMAYSDAGFPAGMSNKPFSKK
jgi:epidermal growth factor receptor substrate 15